MTEFQAAMAMSRCLETHAEKRHDILGMAWRLANRGATDRMIRFSLAFATPFGEMMVGEHVAPEMIRDVASLDMLAGMIVDSMARRAGCTPRTGPDPMVEETRP